MNSATIKKTFNSMFQGEPLMVRSPGRINIIGEHTDYNDGFVFPAAIDKEIYFACAKNNVNAFRFFATDLNEHFELKVADLRKTNTAWANYLLGVVAQFEKLGYSIGGVDCVFGGDIPIGAGLSSSAAIENGFAFALSQLFNISMDKIELVKIAQKAEHEYAGVLCGIMDQFASMNGKENHALKLDCRTLDFEYAPIELGDYEIVLINTKVKHQLVDSEYNMRRKQCEEGVRILKKYNTNIKALRDVSLEFLFEHKAEFDTDVFRRCKYVVGENGRVEKAFVALQNNDLEELGRLMYETHDGLKDDFEVSCTELDLLVAFAKKSKDVVGARMMGGGFGGCTINIVYSPNVTQFVKSIVDHYQDQTGIKPEVYKVQIANGTGIA